MWTLRWQTSGVVNPDKGYVEDETNIKLLAGMGRKLREFGYDATVDWVGVEAPDLVAYVKAHALAHYNDGGWDVIVEAYEDAELEELLAKDMEQLFPPAKTPAEALAKVAYFVDIWAERQADARNSAF
jgi:hypothetical protein